MATKKSKNKGKAKHSPAPFSGQFASKETYFLSDRLKRLSPVNYYVSLATAKEDIIHVLITREHKNGHLSFAIFGLHCETGQLLTCFYQFNDDPDETNALKDRLYFTNFEDKHALELTLYEAEIAHKGLGLKLPEGFRFAINILQYPYEKLVKENHTHLLNFQGEDAVMNLSKKLEQLEQLENNTTSDVPLSHNGESAKAPLSTYDPAYVNGWDEKQWAKFMTQLPDSPVESLREPNFYQPMLYIFEHITLPETERTPVLMEKLEQLKQLKTSLTNLEQKAMIDSCSEEELIIQQGLMMELITANTHKKIATIAKRMEDLVKNYQDNALMHTTLVGLYRELGHNIKAYKLSVQNYQRFPKDELAIIQYFTQIIAANKGLLIQKFLQEATLLEEHLPHQTQFLGINYSNYYVELAKYFYNENHLNEFWQLINYFQQLPAFAHKAKVMDSWNRVRLYGGIHCWQLIKKICSTKEDQLNLAAQIAKISRQTT